MEDNCPALLGLCSAGNWCWARSTAPPVPQAPWAMSLGDTK